MSFINYCYYLGLGIAAGSGFSQVKNPLAEAKKTLAAAPQNILDTLATAPTEYHFPSAKDGLESAIYTGQTFRQVTMVTFKRYIDSLKSGNYPGTADDARAALDSYFSYREDNPNDMDGAIYAFSNHQMVFEDLHGLALPVAEGLYYGDLKGAGKDLRSKIAGNDNPLIHGALLGWNATEIVGHDLLAMDSDGKADAFVEPEDFVDAILAGIAENAAQGSAFEITLPDGSKQLIIEAYLTEDGLDLGQLLQKFLTGAVSFSQTTEDYLSVNKGLQAQNTQYDGQNNYTSLEHQWDEGFGYFGASRSYLLMTPSEISGGLNLDANHDGKLSAFDEVNFGMSVNAAKRDLGDVEAKSRLAQDTVTALTLGRYLIQQKPQGYEPYMQAFAAVAKGSFEKVLAASGLHYINENIALIDTPLAEYSFKEHAKIWSEMKGFLLALQFNPDPILPVAALIEVHDLIGDQPALWSEGEAVMSDYRGKLLQARDILAAHYQYSAATAAGF